MKQKNMKSWVAAAGVLAVAVTLASRAKGELVYENQIPQGSTSSAVRIEERETMRQALMSSERAKATVQAESAAAATAPMAPVVSVPIAAAPAAMAPVQQTVINQQPMQYQHPQVEVGAPRIIDAVEVQNVTKSEAMRRERMRQETQSEDIIHERLEQMRLQDERRRTEALLNSGGLAPQAASVAPAVVIAPPPPPPPAPVLQEQVVVAPATERPGQVPSALTLNSAGGQSTTSISGPSLTEERMILSIQPRAGVSNVQGSTGYDIRARYGAGVGLFLSSGDNLSFEAGYTYSEYGVRLAPTNTYVLALQQMAYLNGTTPSFETVAMKQNVFDLGVKLHVLSQDARVRPFLGGGASYGRSFINYDQSILSYLNRDPNLRGLATDYELSQFMGYVSGGLDMRITKNISIGAVLKYYAVLTSRESHPINNAALYGSYPYGTGYTGAYVTTPDTDKQGVSGSLLKTSFYSALAGITFSF